MPRKISEQLFCEFTPEEIEARGQELSTVMLDYDIIEDRKKDATKEFSETLKGYRTQMRVISKAIRKKGEFRPVECLVHFHTPVVGTKRIVRTDTGEVVCEQAMSPEERQENLFGETSELERMYGLPAPEPEDSEEK